jgi:hypothetical protein
MALLSLKLSFFALVTAYSFTFISEQADGSALVVASQCDIQI